MTGITSRFLTTTWMVYSLIEISVSGSEFSYIISKVVIPSRVKILLRIAGRQGPGTHSSAIATRSSSGGKNKPNQTQSPLQHHMWNKDEPKRMSDLELDNEKHSGTFAVGAVVRYRNNSSVPTIRAMVFTYHKTSDDIFSKAMISILDIPKSRTDPISHGDSSTPWPTLCPHSLRSGLRQAKNVERISYKKNTSVESETADQIFYTWSISIT